MLKGILLSMELQNKWCAFFLLSLGRLLRRLQEGSAQAVWWGGLKEAWGTCWVMGSS